MKVLIVDPMSYNNLEVYDYELVKNLRNLDILFAGNIKFTKNLGSGKSFLIYNYSDKKYFIKVLSYILSQFQLFYIVCFERPKIVHFMWLKLPYFDLLFLVIFKVYFKRIKIVLTVHNVLPHDSGNRFFFVYKWLYNLFDGLVVHELNASKFLVNKFNVSELKVRVIPHGLLDIATHFGVSGTVGVDLLSAFSGSDKLKFLLIGSVSKYKGIEILKAALPSLNVMNLARIMDIFICGDDRNGLTRGMSDIENVYVVDRFLSHEEFIYCLRSSDVIILPYLEISMSGVLMTAILEKKLVIVSPLNGLMAPFSITNIGWVMDDFSPNALVDSILTAIGSYDSTYCNCDFKKVHDFFSWRNIGELTSDFYYSIAI